MKICVLGLGHLGSVTAACMAALGHEVAGVDFDSAVIKQLSDGTAPVIEPRLNELIGDGLTSGRLHFFPSLVPMHDVDLIWVTYDTPIDACDVPDVAAVIALIERVIGETTQNLVLLISSQLPVGSVRVLEQFAAAHCPSRRIVIACSPENLRVGNAVEDFLHPSRIIVGVRAPADKQLLRELLGTITKSIEWMSVESAELTKHAINAFFATSIAFANEVATICESVGADAKDVERGLKSEPRIGARAYLSPGAAFGGGTLARDLAFLTAVASEHGLPARLLTSVLPSNDEHKHWAQHKLQSLFSDLTRTTIAVWGLAYKPGTESLRRSAAVELCDWLLHHGVTVRVHDPMVVDLPAHWHEVTRCRDPLEAIRGADALVLATGWPMYASISAKQLALCSEHLAVLDANRTLACFATGHTTLSYLTVGMTAKES
jgi:UDPglucose 6-dehydrogenase